MEFLDALRTNVPLLVGTVGLLGLCVGSLLNVVIHRLPRMMEAGWREECAALEGREAPPRETYNLFTPPSACPSCGTPIRAIHNIPVVSWLALRGKCSSCSKPISVRYPIVEALTAGLFWGVYILLVQRVGQAMEGGQPLALAMAAGTIMISPVGIAQGGGELLSVSILVIGAGVAVLSSVIPYTFELEALRRMPSNVFGVLMSLEPAVAALAGFVVLGQTLGARDLVAIALVICASVGVTRTSAPPVVDA